MAGKARSFIAPDMTAVTPYLYIEDARAAIAFYEQALGATLRFKMDGPGDTVMHGEMMVNGSLFMLGEANAEMNMKSPKMIGGTANGVFVYVPDVDATYEKAIALGATPARPPEDMFWGDRTASLIDPFGHSWSLATHVEDVSAEEIAKRVEDWTKANAG